MRDGVPCTPIDRTVLDLGAVVGVDRLTDIVDEVIRSQVLTWRQLEYVIRRSNGGEVGRFDLVYPDARLVIELDSRTL